MLKNNEPYRYARPALMREEFSHLGETATGKRSPVLRGRPNPGLSEVVEDAVLIDVEAGQSFVVRPDYGHLQINPSAEPLIFSYTVMDGMQGVYAQYRDRRGAIYYEMAYILPLGVAEVKRSGSDITVVATSWTVSHALRA
jgi:hypothetical protein